MALKKKDRHKFYTIICAAADKKVDKSGVCKIMTKTVQSKEILDTSGSLLYTKSKWLEVGESKSFNTCGKIPVKANTST